MAQKVVITMAYGYDDNGEGVYLTESEVLSSLDTNYGMTTELSEELTERFLSQMLELAVKAEHKSVKVAHYYARKNSYSTRELDNNSGDPVMVELRFELPQFNEAGYNSKETPAFVKELAAAVEDEKSAEKLKLADAAREQALQNLRDAKLALDKAETDLKELL